MKVSVIIPVYNEAGVIGNCLASLKKQTIPLEVVIVDDGSTDGSEKYATYKQSHKGPGAARNLGSSKATGDILVFVDADMEFAPNFIEKLIVPIEKKQAIGTFSKEEYLLNKNNQWARYWNLNLGREEEKMHSKNYPDKQPVFRAILKKEFLKVSGFDVNIGYTDDWSLSKKLGLMAVAVSGAKYYHRNPETLHEVWTQARWFGKNEFLTKNLVRQLYNLMRYCPLWAFNEIFSNFEFFKFKIVFNSAVFVSILLSFFNEHKAK